MNKFLKISLLFLGLQIGTLATMQAVNQNLIVLKENGIKILKSYVKDTVDRGDSLNKEYMKYIITLHKIDHYDQGFSLREFMCCLDLPCASLLVFEYIQDLVKVGIDVNYNFVEIIIPCIYSGSYWESSDHIVEKTLYSDEALFAKFKETMELLISNGSDRTPYEAFLVNFEEYKIHQFVL